MTIKTIISDNWNLVKQDVYKILKGAMIAAVGAFCTFILSNVGSIDFGVYTPFISGAISVLFNTILKLVSTTTYIK